MEFRMGETFTIEKEEDEYVIRILDMEYRLDRAEAQWA